MILRARYSPVGPFFGILLLLAMLNLTGCPGSQRVLVRPLPNRQAVELSSDDIVRVMKRAGFSDEQILEHGTDLRNQLANSGASQFEVAKKVEAMFAVDGRYLHVTSRLKGSFIYDVGTGRIR